MPSFFLLIFPFLAIGSFVNGTPIDKPTLKGVTTLYAPHVMQTENASTFHGFSIDVLEDISTKVGFNYSFYLSPVQLYGSVVEGKMTGMIGQVYEKKADFAIADIIKTPLRQEYVSFTESLLSFKLSAIIREEYSANVSSLEDLINLKRSGADDEAFEFVLLSPGNVFNIVMYGNSLPARQLAAIINQQGNSSYVASHYEGISRFRGRAGVAPPRVAMLMNSLSAEWWSSMDCELAVLPEMGTMYAQEIAIAMQKDSPYLEPFNEAIREMKAKGRLRQLKEKHWKRKCSPGCSLLCPID